MWLGGRLAGAALRDGRLAERSRVGRARRGLQLALGLLWLLDAALQLQPFMFTPAFARTVIAPAVAAEPAWISVPGLWAAHLIAHDPLAFNALFALTQLAIGAGLIWRRTVRAALAASVAWAMLVWWLGEGLGGVLSGHASPLTGAPGAVILYALLALLAWPSRRAGGSIAASSVLRPSGAAAAWLALWATEAGLALQPGASSGRSLHEALTEGASGEPTWLASVDRWVAAGAAHHSATVTALLVTLLALSAVAVLAPGRLERELLGVAALVAACVWLLGESLGGILTGQATDPNTGPALLLIVLAYWPLRPARRGLSAAAVAARACAPRRRASGAGNRGGATTGDWPRAAGLRRRRPRSLPSKDQRKEVVRTLSDSSCGTLEVTGR